MKYPLNKLQRKAVDQIYERFMAERTQGYLDTKGTRHEPVSKEEAQRLWDESGNQAEFEQVMFDPEVIEKFGLGKDEPIPAEAVVPWEDVKHQFSRPGNQ